MKTKPSILIIMFLAFCNFYCYNVKSQTISKEQAFFYFVKIYNYSVTTPVKSGGGYSQCGDDLFTHYAYIFDNYNYLQSRNDEFKKHEFINSTTAKFKAALANVNFERKFTVSCQGSFGEYSFENSSFPIKFTENEYRIGYRIPFYKDDCFMEINVGEICNLAEFKWNLAYPMDKAQSFISRRKYSNGQINRTIYFKLTYSIVNQTSFSANYATNLNGSNIIIYLYSIDIFGDQNLTEKLGTLLPTMDYEDKIHGIKNKNGAETIYYKDGYNGVWLPCSKDEAKYYRIINYVGGKINGTVKDYFISGALQMEGTYPGYYAKDGLGNGLFTWYYENGQKSVEVNYTDGKPNGQYNAWYSNGAKKEEVNYLDGKKNGCDYIWDESGNAKFAQGYSWKFFDFYNNGEKVLYNRDCPFVSITEKERNDKLPKQVVIHPTNGQEKIYYDRYWKVCEEKNAKYYRIINYVDGEISGTVKDFWMNGQIQMEGTYLPDCADKGCENGLFTFYWEREWGKDLKKEVCTIIKGKRVGIIKTYTIYGNESQRQATNGQ